MQLLCDTKIEAYLNQKHFGRLKKIFFRNLFKIKENYTYGGSELKMKHYLDTLKYILENGTDRQNRTGISTRAVFGMQLRFNMEDGFPAVTTKKLAFNSVKAELLWFISGSSDVKELQKHGCHIWDANADAPYWKPKARFLGD